jgi:ribosomal protein S27AE
VAVYWPLWHNEKEVGDILEHLCPNCHNPMTYSLARWLCRACGWVER